MGRSGIEFCCFGLPLINFGSYTICFEFMFVSACLILLAIIPPQIVATAGALPSGFPKIIIAALGAVCFLWQLFGIVSIRAQKTSLYRTYIRINFVLTLLVIVATVAFFAASAAQHNTVLTSCTNNYGAQPAGSSSLGNSTLQDLGSTICNIFIWVQVGAMGLLILLLGLTQLYFCALQRIYGQAQRRADHDRKVYTGTGADEIPLATRGSGIWDAPTTGYGNGAQRNVAPIDTHSLQGSEEDGYASNNVRSSYRSPTREDARQSYPSYNSYGGGKGRY